MSILDKLMGRRAERGIDDDTLRELLFAAVAAGDTRKLAKLCREHEEQIVAAFPRWQTVPPELRSDAAAFQRWGEGVLNVAHCFDELLGRPELLALLLGQDGDNPITQWENALEKADTLIAERSYRDALDLLQPTLTQLESCSGPSVGNMIATTLERLASCRFHLGEAEFAKPMMERALSLCEQDQDFAGIANSLRGLYEIHRFVGDSDSAAACAMRLATLLGQYATPDEAARWRRNGERVRSGEPLNRVVIHVRGERYEMDELARIPANIDEAKGAFERNRISLGSVTALVEQGKAAAMAGQFEGSLELYRQAANIDPYDPDPHYQAGMSLLYLKRYAEAAHSYEETERRAPGWFHCRQERWLAQQLADGNVSHEAFLLLRDLEDGGLSQEQKARLVEEALREGIRLAVLQLHLGQNLFFLGRREAAREALLKGLSSPGETDVETRLLFALANVVDSKEQREDLLRRTVELNGNLFSASMAALLLRHSVQ